MSHTFGPWQVDLLGDYYRVVTMHGASDGFADDVALVGSIKLPRSLPNAQLIAAAPDLLQSCKAALGAFENNNCIDWNDLTLAIAKAEGKR